MLDSSQEAEYLERSMECPFCQTSSDSQVQLLLHIHAAHQRGECHFVEVGLKPANI